MEQIITENKRLREKVKTLEAQLDKLKRKQLILSLKSIYILFKRYNIFSTIF